MTNILIATTVSASGFAEAPYNLATFNIVVHRVGETQLEVKEALALSSNNLQKLLDELEKNKYLKIVKGSVTAQPHINVRYVYKEHNRVPEGYEGSYNLSFTTSELKHISVVYDRLSVLEGVQVHQPTFSIKSHDKLNTKALAHAWKNVSKRFEDECKVLGLNYNDYAAATWETSYSDSHRTGRRSHAANSSRPTVMNSSSVSEATVGAALSDDSEIDSAVLKRSGNSLSSGLINPVLEIIVGKASVSVNLNVSYVKKNVGY